MSVSATSLTAAASTGATASATASAAAANPLAALSDNFNDFLGLLTKQLQNQDPTSPMDTNTFTTELVQFTSVEQQISTNANLTQLIQATQGTEVIQAANVEGKSIDVTSANLALQSGTGGISFSTATPEPVQIAVTDGTGAVVKTATIGSAAGVNAWSWDGVSDAGVSEPDGAYGVAVTTTSASGAVTQVPFDVIGTATGVSNANGTVSVTLGAVTVPFASITSLGK